MATHHQRPATRAHTAEPLYVGIDIGKQRHIAGFISTELLQRHIRFEACPTVVVEQSRVGFRTLLDHIHKLAPLEQVSVIMEQTGHYHRPLLQYLLEQDLPVYVMHVQKRAAGLIKTDRRDALNLANHLYNQLDRGIQVADKLQLIRRAIPPAEAAAQLHGLIQHRYELIRESTQRKNKLTAICDELFPEFTTVFKNPNLPRALAVREAYPTPTALAETALAETALAETALAEANLDASGLSAEELSHPVPAAVLQRLCGLTGASIGTRDPARVAALVFEQGQLIKELRLLQDHLARLEERSSEIVEQSREGHILLSIPPIGPMHAAVLLATIGSIANFASAAALKSYLGWAPAVAQSGSSLDRTALTRGGNHPAKQTLYLVAWAAIRMDTEWATIYQRLVPRKCAYDERLREYRGRKRVIGRICGQLVSLIYTLLRHDYETLAHLAPGATPPPPALYDRETHHRHCQGHYVPHPKERPQNHLVLQPG